MQKPTSPCGRCCHGQHHAPVAASRCRCTSHQSLCSTQCGGRLGVSGRQVWVHMHVCTGNTYRHPRHKPPSRDLTNEHAVHTSLASHDARLLPSQTTTDAGYLSHA
eukprot:364023-Chlamydomonas_euryale.AAC.9